MDWADVELVAGPDRIWVELVDGSDEYLNSNKVADEVAGSADKLVVKLLADFTAESGAATNNSGVESDVQDLVHCLAHEANADWTEIQALEVVHLSNFSDGDVSRSSKDNREKHECLNTNHFYYKPRLLNFLVPQA
jgi:hypothetical protein